MGGSVPPVLLVLASLSVLHVVMQSIDANLCPKERVKLGGCHQAKHMRRLLTKRWVGGYSPRVQDEMATSSRRDTLDITMVTTQEQ